MKKFKSGEKVRVYGYARVAAVGKHTRCYEEGDFAYFNGHVGRYKAVLVDKKLGIYSHTVKLPKNDLLKPFGKIKSSLMSTAVIEVHPEQLVKAGRK